MLGEEVFDSIHVVIFKIFIRFTAFHLVSPGVHIKTW